MKTSFDYNHIEIHYFLQRLDDSETIGVIRDISEAIKEKKGNESLCSESYDDISVGIDFPDFYIEDFKLPLIEMKNILYQWLESINPKSNEYLEEIEIIDYSSFRTNHLLKFRYIKDEFGNKKKICESLCSRNKPYCFVQYCSLKECFDMIKQIEKAQISNINDSQIYENKIQDINIRIKSNWFTIGSLSRNGYAGIHLESAKSFLQDWIEFIRIENKK